VFFNLKFIKAPETSLYLNEITLDEINDVYSPDELCVISVLSCLNTLFCQVSFDGKVNR